MSKFPEAVYGPTGGIGRRRRFDQIDRVKYCAIFMDMHRTTVLLDPAVKAKAKLRAKRLGISLSRLIRNSLEAEVAREPAGNRGRKSSLNLPFRILYDSRFNNRGRTDGVGPHVGLSRPLDQPDGRDIIRRHGATGDHTRVQLSPAFRDRRIRTVQGELIE